MEYLTYSEYTEMGGTLNETEFSREIYRAYAIIDSRTFDRLLTATTISPRVKHCCKDLVECLANTKNAEGKTVASRSQKANNLTESETYSSATADERNADMLEIVYDYLINEKDENGTPLMYRGANI